MTNRALACLFTVFGVVRSLGFCPFAPNVVSKLTSCFATSATSFKSFASSGCPAVTESFAIYCATSGTGLGICTISIYPSVLCAKAFTTSVTTVVAISYVCMTELVEFFCLCMLRIVSTCVCLNTCYCTGRFCCYFAIIPSVCICNDVDFFCIRVTTSTCECLNTCCCTSRSKSYCFGVAMLVNCRIFGPFTSTIIPNTFCNCVAVVFVGRNCKVRCLVPLIIPVVSCCAGIHTAEDYVCITLVNTSFPNAVAIFISHANPCIACIVPHINCESCIIRFPVSIRNKVECNCDFRLGRNILAVLSVSNGIIGNVVCDNVSSGSNGDIVSTCAKPTVINLVINLEFCCACKCNFNCPSSLVFRFGHLVIIGECPVGNEGASEIHFVSYGIFSNIGFNSNCASSNVISYNVSTGNKRDVLTLNANISVLAGKSCSVVIKLE